MLAHVDNVILFVSSDIFVLYKSSQMVLSLVLELLISPEVDVLILHKVKRSLYCIMFELCSCRDNNVELVGFSFSFSFSFYVIFCLVSGDRKSALRTDAHP